MDRSLLTYQKIKEIITSKGWKFYTAPYNINIIGVRTADNTPNVFNDFLCVAYIDENGRENLFISEATTDPGLYWLENPMNVKGTAILAPGQWRSLWKIGMHQGKYEALVQFAPCGVYRDSDRDKELDCVNLETGKFGINCHRAAENDEMKEVGKFSAGCQVHQLISKFREFMRLCRLQVIHGHGDVFSYTLLTESDFGS